MELINKEIKVPSRSTIVRIYFLYDFHVGEFGFDDALLKRHVNRVLTEEFSYAILGGDLGACIGKKDGRYDPRSISPMFHEDMTKNNLVGAEYSYTRNLLKPLADKGKLLAYVEGNHEKKLAVNTDYDFCSQMYEDLKVPYGGGCCVLGIRFKRQSAAKSCIINAIHGKRGGATTASKVTALERQATRIRGCHIYTRGHGHIKFMLPGERVGVRFLKNSGGIEEYAEAEAKGSSGSYSRILVQGGSNYAEDGEYMPADLGCIFAEIQPFKAYTHKRDKMIIELRDLKG